MRMRISRGSLAGCSATTPSESAKATRKVSVSAAIGVAESQPDDSLRSLLDRADAAMYRDKRRSGQPS